MKTTDSALLGHVSRDALSAAALSDLWTMCTQVLLSGRVLGVLVGGAVGAGNHKLAGIYLQVSLFVLSIVALFVAVCWNLTEQIWVAFGSDPQISQMAGYYSSALSFAIPGVLVFGQLSQFFSAQRIMTPEVNSSSIGLVMNLVLGLIFVLGVGIPGFDGFGFVACPIVTSLVTYFQLAAIVGIYVVGKQLHAPGSSWHGWNWNEITWARIKIYSELYFPSALASASDFWRVAVIGAVAAKLGEEEVAVFNTSYRYAYLVCHSKEIVVARGLYSYW
jgi:MATE family multidrug resistance protein